MRCGVTQAVCATTLGIHPKAAEEFVTVRKAAAMGCAAGS
jgi:plasmid maintenance system antidote protein VapI